MNDVCGAQKVTALVLAVYKYEQRRSSDIVSLLLEQGADVNAAIPASCDRRISIVKAQAGGAAGAPGSGSTTGTSAVGLGNTGTSLVSEQHSTRKIALAGKTPLLVRVAPWHECFQAPGVTQASGGMPRNRASLKQAFGPCVIVVDWIRACEAASRRRFRRETGRETIRCSTR